MKTLQKVRADTGVIHVRDREGQDPGDAFDKALCGETPVWRDDQRFTDRLPVSCRECRTAVTAWLLGGPLD